MHPCLRDAVILTGPTASGKTALGLELAERLEAEIVAMDSMTLYRGMDIGTAKPTQAERERVPHHLLDVLDPWESASVAWWLEEALAVCQEIQRRGKRVLFVGGTPLYLKAMLFGLFEGPAADEEARARLTQQMETEGGPALHARLAQVDPITAARLHPNDVRRVIRALEVWELTGQPISQQQKEWSRPLAGTPRAFWIDLPRQKLYDRINQRVLTMLEAGWLEEVSALRALPKPISKEASQALGYKELFAHLDGEITLEQAIERIQTRSRQFAKRQITWFRHLPGLEPIGEQLTAAALQSTMDLTGQ